MRIPRIMAKAPGRDAGELDEVRVDAIAAEFREAFFADVTEEVRAELVYEIHLKMRGQQEIYEAVGIALGSRLKNAIRKYIDAYRERYKPPCLVKETDEYETNLFLGR